MKIAIPAFILQNGKSGIATYAQELLRHLNPVHEYHIFLPKKDSHLLPYFSQRTSPNWVENPLVNFFWNNSIFPCISKKFDLVHYPCARKVGLWQAAQTIATVHDLGPYLHKEKYGALRHIYHHLIYPQALKKCSHLIAVSQTTKNDLMHYLDVPEEKISVIYSGVDRTFFRYTEERVYQRPYFIYVSRIEHPAKNHVRLIEAFELFQQRNRTDHDLLFVGSDWNGAEEVHKRANSSPCRERIQFLGFTPKEQLPSLYSHADCMIFPSLFEGFGFPLIEATACGAKVIASNTTSLNEIATLGNIPTFNPKDPKEIAITLENELYASKVCREEFLSQFSWEKTAHDVGALYDMFA